MKKNETLLREFHANTRPAEEFGYKDDHKRLQREFDANVHLRYHTRKKICQVWYRSPNECMPVCEITTPYNICRAIRYMKDKERTRRENMLEWQMLEEMEKLDKKKKIRDVATEVGNATKNVMNGRVSMLMR